MPSMRHARASSVVAVVACVALAACERPTGLCDLSRPLAVLEVTAVDSVSGALVPNAVITATGPAPDSALIVVPDSASIGTNVAAYPVRLGSSVGNYVVTVHAVGYRVWTQAEAVTYAAGTCHGDLPMAVTAVMQASP